MSWKGMHVNKWLLQLNSWIHTNLGIINVSI